MTADQYIAWGAIGTCLSATAALMTLIVIYRQLRAAYRPEFALSQTVIKSTTKSKSIVPVLWTETFHSEPTEAWGTIGRLVIPIRNIGLGAANEVDVKWSFPIEKAVQEVNACSGSIRIVTYNRGSGRLNVKLNDNEIMSASWLAHRKQRIDFIIPSSIESTPILLAVPDAYAIVVSAMTFFYAKTDKPQKELSVPVLRLDMRYRDIGRGRCRVSYAIDCDIAVFNQDGEIVRGYLRCKRVG